MNKMLLKKFMVTQNDCEDSECSNNFIEVVKTRHFNNNLECKIQKMYHYQSPANLTEGAILVHTNDYGTELSGEIELNGLNISSIEKQLSDMESSDHLECNNLGEYKGHVSCDNNECNDELRVIIQSDEEYDKPGCIFSSQEFNILSNRSPFSSHIGIDNPFGSYTSIDDTDMPFNHEREVCIKSLITYLNLVLMLFSLLVPLFLHIFYQFKLYHNIMDIKTASNSLKETHDINKKVLIKLTEFENFFFLGVTIYVIIQLIGSFITYSRYNLYLKHLYTLSIKNSKDDLINNHKDNAVKKLNTYFRNISIDDNVLNLIKKNLVKSFNEVSYKFNNCNMKWIWDRVNAYKFKSLVLKIWLPFCINVCTSFIICLYIYYKRFRLNYKVPLAHFKIVSNMYWNVALNYEGFIWITFIFTLNIISWVLLMIMNRNFYKFINDTQFFLSDIMDNFNSQVSDSIWDREVSFIIRNL